MQLYRIILACLVFFALSCGRESGKATAPEAPEAAVPMPEEVREGAVTEYYDSGTVREKYTLSDGKLQGQYLRYRPN